MSLDLRWTVIGIFEEQGQAQQVIDELRQAGFNDDQIGFVFRESEPAVSKADVEAEENTGAFKGGIIGGILGAADALLTPVLGPTVANTIPTATMPVAEQAIDRLQQAGTDDGRGQVEREAVETAPARNAGDTEDTEILRFAQDDKQGLQGDKRGPQDDKRGQVKTPTDEDTQILRFAQDDKQGPQDDKRVLQDDKRGQVETPADENAGAPSEARDDNREKRLIEEEATGAVTGGIVGGVLGAAVALLIPVIGPAFAGGILVTVFSAALGAVTGGMLGALVTLGVPEEQALHYEEEFRAGRTIVTVKTEDQQQKVLDIMYHNGTRYANAHDRL